MPRIAYIDKRFGAEALAKIEKANEIIREYQDQGLDLTLRQLYYQFVSRALIPNNERSYKNLGSLVSDGREAGLIDWNAIVDRTRFLRQLSHFDNPEEIVRACSQQFRIDKWAAQPRYVEVWIEKDALIGVIEGVCEQNDVPYLACRGYASASEVWNAGRNRLKAKIADGKECVVLYLGDHDPSGIDMTRNVRERLVRYAEAEDGEIEVVRLALNMEQVDEYSPPPNPTKMTDSRANWYIETYGEECWELDALDPVTIRDMIDAAIGQYRDDERWEADCKLEANAKTDLLKVSKNWQSIVKKLK